MPVFDGTDTRQDELQALVQFAFMRRPLAELLSACAGASLEIIVLKGAALAETVYPRPSLRPFGDIDILVRPEDSGRAHALLSGLGYVAEAASWAGLRAGQTCEANFFRHTERGPVVVELHTNLLNNALLWSQVHLDLPGLWQRSRPARLAGVDALVLGPEDQLLHLCLHLAGHYFDAPKSLQDIKQVCAVQSVNWPLFVALCRKAGAASIGYGGLFAAAQQGAAVPPSVLESLALLESLTPRRRRTLETLITARVQNRAASGTEAQRFKLIWLLGSPSARVSAVRHLFFPVRPWLHGHYYYHLTESAWSRRLPLGLRLYASHLRFLFQTLGSLSRKSRRRP